MRKFIIDTDIGSDDAVAVIMALKSEEVKIEAITCVSGNCSLDNVVKNALMTIEVTNAQKPPVYRGAYEPLMREKFHAINVHGNDGMGDCDLIHPTTSEAEGHASDKILELVNCYPNEIEIIALGPATNIALAIMKDRKTMQKVKHIWSMGTCGFGVGNCTPVSEFNVYADPEAYDVMLQSRIECTLIGFDICLKAPWGKDELEYLLASDVPEAVFAVKCNKSLLEYNLNRSGKYVVDLPDAIAMAVALWDDVATELPGCYCTTSLTKDATYGQVVVHDTTRTNIVIGYSDAPVNAFVCRDIYVDVYKRRLQEILLK